MDRLREAFSRFMQGRYGIDELGRSMCTVIIIAFIISIVLNMAANFTGLVVISVLSSIVSLLATCAMLYTLFRAFSRDYAKREAENERFVDRQNAARKRRKRRENQKDFKYLTCPFCGQEMRVPKGKGKIAVKCPKCGEKTVTKS